VNSAYTVLWTKARYDGLCNDGDEGKSITVLFGGIHQSAPSLVHAGSAAGDVVFPVVVHAEAVHIISGAVIKEFIELNRYAVEYLGLKRKDVEGRPEYEVMKLIASLATPLGHRRPYGCDIEVALVERSTPIRFDVAIPPEDLGSVTFCPRKGPPVGLRHIEGGKLKSSVSLQGNIRRLCPESARLFCGLVGLQPFAR